MLEIEREGGGGATAYCNGFKKICTSQVGIQLTASHLGNFQFKICSHNNPTVPVSQECLNQHRLNLAGTNEHHFYPEETGYYEIELQLPQDMTCSQCILQWHYTAGNIVTKSFSLDGQVFIMMITCIPIYINICLLFQLEIHR